MLMTSKCSILAFTLLTFAAMGCSSTTTTPAPATDAGTTPTGDGATGTPTDSGSETSTGDVCAEIAQQGASINKDHDPGPPPAMTGGTIADGTYVLTKMVQYNGENGNLAHQETMVFAGGNGQIVGTENGTTQRLFFTYTTSGIEITKVVSCGGPAGSVKQQYTATATTFVSVNNGDKNELHTFTKK